MTKTNPPTKADLFGASVSGLCAIHCTLTPLLFAAKPVLTTAAGADAHAGGLWASLDFVFLLLSLVAVWWSARRAARPTLRWGLWIAWLVFAAGLLTEPLDFSGSKWLMYAGSISLIMAHLKNHRACRVT